MIVDEADREMEVTADPFLEAGIDIPKELPYHDKSPRMSIRRSGAVGDTDSVAGSIASMTTRTASFMGLSRLSRFRKKKANSDAPALDGDANVNSTLAAEMGLDMPSTPAGGGVAESLPHNMKPGESKAGVTRMLTIPGSRSSDTVLDERDEVAEKPLEGKQHLDPDPDGGLVMRMSMTPNLPPILPSSPKIISDKNPATSIDTIDGLVNEAFISDITNAVHNSQKSPEVLQRTNGKSDEA